MILYLIQLCLLITTVLGTQFGIPTKTSEPEDTTQTNIRGFRNSNDRQVGNADDYRLLHEKNARKIENKAVSSGSPSGSGSGSATIDNDNITSVATPSSYTNSVALHWATFAAMDGQLYNMVYLSLPISGVSVDASLTQQYSSMVNASYTPGHDAFFTEPSQQSSLYDVYLSVYNELPQEAKSSIASYVNFYYSRFDVLGSSTQTEITETLSLPPTSWTTSAASDYYMYAGCNAVWQELFHASRYKYAVFFETYSDKSLITDIYDAYNSLTDQSDTESSDFENSIPGICQTLMSVVDIVPWKEELLYKAYGYYSRIISLTITYGTNTYTPPLTYSTDWVTMADINSTSVFATYYPYQVFFNVTVSDSDTTDVLSLSTVTTFSQNTTISTGSCRNVLSTTRTITSNLEDAVSCGVDALIYDYYNNKEDFSRFLDQHSNESYVQTYTDIIKNYKSVDINEKNDSYPIVMSNFYNFIFKLPTDRKLRLMSYMGYCYLERGTEKDNSLYTFRMNSYTEQATGSILGSFFTDIFKLGNGDECLWFRTTTDSNYDVRVIETRQTQSKAYDPIIPTSVLGTGVDGNNTVPVLALSKEFNSAGIGTLSDILNI